ncbi:hypothetical protein, partial [Azotobacter salinestris]|uniref:hypothetical protein n=1 Tax=Azotobacter salinestris TaxID=69964 RepID=UPI0032DFD97D
VEVAGGIEVGDREGQQPGGEDGLEFLWSHWSSTLLGEVEVSGRRPGLEISYRMTSIKTSPCSVPFTASPAPGSVYRKTKKPLYFDKFIYKSSVY